MNILSSSILAADFWKLGEDIACVERTGCRYLHIDVMDGVFVPAISFGMPVIKSIRRRTDLFFDVHLMIVEPEKYVEEFAQCGADLINFHLEATECPEQVIAKIRKTGKKAGITIKPGTPAEAVFPYLSEVDMVLVMTVEPGFGGQKLMLECLEKVRTIRKYAEEKQIPMDIQVDGGIKKDNVHLALEAGANVIVAGSAIFREDAEANIRAFLDVMAE